jgi:hypothetical protein
MFECELSRVTAAAKGLLSKRMDIYLISFFGI